MSSAVAETRADRNRFAALAFNWGDLLFELDHACRVAYSAGPLAQFTGRPEGEIIGTKIGDLVMPADGPALANFLKEIRSGRRCDTVRVRLRHKKIGSISGELSGYCMDDRFFLGLRVRGQDRKTAETSVSAETAGLPETADFSLIASEHVKRLEREGKAAHLTVVEVPALAEAAGCLGEAETKRLAMAVGKHVKGTALGGVAATALSASSFGILHDNPIDIAALKTRIAKAVSAEGLGDQVDIAHTTMAMNPQGLDEQDMAKGLIYALGSVRRNVGADVPLADLPVVISSLIEQSLADVGQFRKILNERSFTLSLHPIIGTRTGLIHHYEALCRFNPELPLQSPHRYISLAEESGLIHEFDLAMVEKVLAWLRRMPMNNNRFSVAINISGFSIGVGEYQRELKSILESNPWTTHRVLFEITESSRMTNLEEANDFIQSLRRAGYAVCLDDFGAGAASFQYLSALDVDVVKIDGSAVHNARKAVKGRAFLSALTELCSRLGVETIAEMIDSTESFRFVRDCRCNYVQGFLFGRPSTDVQVFHPLPNREIFHH